MKCWCMDSPSTEIPHKKGGVILGTIKKEKVGIELSKYVKCCLLLADKREKENVVS